MKRASFDKPWKTWENVVQERVIGRTTFSRSDDFAASQPMTARKPSCATCLISSSLSVPLNSFSSCWAVVSSSKTVFRSMLWTSLFSDSFFGGGKLLRMSSRWALQVWNWVINPKLAVQIRSSRANPCIQLHKKVITWSYVSRIFLKKNNYLSLAVSGRCSCKAHFALSSTHTSFSKAGRCCMLDNVWEE